MDRDVKCSKCGGVLDEWDKKENEDARENRGWTGEPICFKCFSKENF